MSKATAPQTLQAPLSIENLKEVIRLERVGVCYRVPSERILSFKEYAIRWLQRRITSREFWALKEVTFSVHQGETFGLIGANGAGKSTLLKVVARVIRPTEGRVVVVGHVAPLLEFGAGFHPDLTGRENIYLNGAILGFSRKEMEAKLERIVDFAELWDFIDAPIRTYSSGMSARLGFAIATDIEPDVLLVDEVFSVGDEAFRRKSEARMREFRERGTTIMFVSHSMESVKELCHRVAWIDHGHVKAVGYPEEVINAYRNSQLG